MERFRLAVTLAGCAMLAPVLGGAVELPGGRDVLTGRTHQKRVAFSHEGPTRLELALSERGSICLHTIQLALDREGKVIAHIAFSAAWHVRFRVYVAAFNKEGTLVAAGNAEVDSLHDVEFEGGRVFAPGRPPRGRFSIHCGCLAPAGSGKVGLKGLKGVDHIIVSAWASGSC